MVSFLNDSNFLSIDEKVAHGFFGRAGGVSSGLYGSLNCGLGTKDLPANVEENRARVCMALGVHPARLTSVKQIHSADCHYIDKPWGKDERPSGDAMVTDIPGLALGILTADCGPVLFYGEKVDGSPIIGAAHAGWGGAFKGVLEATVKTMLERGAVVGTLRASIGPSIGPKSYEVGMDFVATFLNENPETEHFFKSAKNNTSDDAHMMFDLSGYSANRLAACGVRAISITGVDTYPESSGYFSYRRTTHAGEQDYGRQISALVIR